MKSGFQRAQALMQNLLARLRLRFSLTRLLRTRDDLVLLREGGKDAEWVISRGLSLFLGINCSGVPRKRRDAFIAAAVRRSAPFAAPGWHTAWHGEQAMVWVWPQEDLAASALDIASSEFDSGRSAVASNVRRLLPESLLRGEPMETGVELVACSDGVEARAWKQGVLYASNWWPVAPDRAAWMTFCRGAGIPFRELPEANRVPWRDLPWTSSTRHPLHDSLSRAQQYALPAIAALLVLWAGVQLGGLVRLELGTLSLERDIRQSSDKVSDILTDRNHAQDDLAAARKLLSLRPPATQMHLLNQVTGLLEQSHAVLRRWAMPNPDHLEVTVSMTSPDPRALVLAFQNSGVFSNVSADVGRGSKDQLVVRADINRFLTQAKLPDARKAGQ